MLGAIIGDTVGSRFEWHNHRSKDFEFLTYKCEPTDDSIMTFAIAKAILKSEGKVNKLPDLAVRYMQQLGRLYPDAGYGGAFREWIRSNNPKPYNSFGNGAAMRVSPVGFAAKSLDEAKAMSKAVTKVTHNHPEGLKGAEATTVAIFMALHGKSMLEIRDYIDKNYYPMNFTLDGIRDSYQFNETCQDTVPQAMMAFFESTGFEDAIRNAISIGGDSDTLAAITGGIAEAYYGIPSEIRKHELTFLDERLLAILVEFEKKHPVRNFSISYTRMTKTEKAVQWMISTANNPRHGYDQKYRWGERGDYDCSSAVITAWESAGVPVKGAGATYTGNMYSAFKKCGFADVTQSVNLKAGSGLLRGDVLLNRKFHTAMYIGNNQIVQASANEKGTATGGSPGDQTGKEFLVRAYYNYPWDYVLRYPETAEKVHKKTDADLAREVLRGLWGNGSERIRRLRNAGYNPGEIQKLVNKMILG